jgi:eukaryotic-like serine/threonine-protein kinase
LGVEYEAEHRYSRLSTVEPTQGESAEAPIPAAAPPQAFKPTPGTQITSLITGNTYTFGEPIGEGFFSDVYSCTDVWNNELAVKVLKPLLPLEALREAATREFQTLLTVRHPHVTHIYDAFEFQSAFFIVTERCFASLEELFELEDLKGWVWLMPMARCLLQAVHSLHVMGIVHQDIHLGNVMTKLHKDEMVSDREAVWHFKLCDLGIARLNTDLAATELRKRSIIPPEVIDPDRFGPLDHRIDIYHLGLLLLQLALSRRLEFTAEEILAGKPRELALTLPAPYSLALEKALRRRVQYRTASALELWRDLNSPVGA